MRLPYAPSQPADPAHDPDTHAIYSRIASRRHPRPLIPLDLALLRAPPLADGWTYFVNTIRTHTALSPALLELAVCRVAVLNGASYAFSAHGPLALKAGVSKEGVETVRKEPCAGAASSGDGEGGGRRLLEKEDGEGGLRRREWVVLAYADEMTRKVRVGDDVFAALRRPEGAGGAGLGDREVVELTAAVAAYNAVCRFLVALDVGEWNGVRIEDLEVS